MFELKDKVAIVTGGAGVLGGSIVKSLIEAEAKVAIIDICQENIDTRVEELRGSRRRSVGFVSSVLDSDKLKQTRKEILDI